MRKIYWLLVFALTACTTAQINQTIGEVNKAMGTTPAEKPLTTAEVGDGLKAFWKVISPVPVTLKRFLALEFVFTFGIV